MFHLASPRVRDLLVLFALLGCACFQGVDAQLSFPVSEDFEGSSPFNFVEVGSGSIAGGDYTLNGPNNSIVTGYLTSNGSIDYAPSGTLDISANLTVEDGGGGGSSSLSVEIAYGAAEPAQNSALWQSIYANSAPSTETLNVTTSLISAESEVWVRFVVSARKDDVTLDDISLTFTADPTVDGCVDSEACNYNSSANNDDGSCIYATGCDVCSGATDGTGTVIPGSGVTFSLEITADNYPGETSWEVVDDDGGELPWEISLGTEGQAGGATSTYTTCFPPTGSYTFTIDDSAGDGICCAFGNGSYTLTVDGVLVGTGGNFGTSESFNVVFGCTDGNASNYDPSANVDDGTCSSSGCTDVGACNYNASATTDDGSCIQPDANGDCCTLMGSTAAFLSGGETDTLWFQVDSGIAETLTLDLEWIRYGTDNGQLPADLVVELHDPSGGCAWLGGESTWTVSGCSGLGTGDVLYNNDWTTGVGQTFTGQDTLDVSASGLTGTGTWFVVIGNGRAGTSAVSYNLGIGLDYVCGVQLVEGCTAETACNFDALAEVDDGSCFFAVGEGGCACEISGSGLDTVVYSSPVGTPMTFDATSVDGPELFTMTLDFTNVSDSSLVWPSDMVVRMLDPNGNCSWFGGYDFTAEDVPGCEASDELTDVSWPPPGWNSSQSGSYSAALDLSASTLTGSGTWSITLLNGWSGIVFPSGAQSDNTVVYDLDWSLTGLCSLGCTDPLACNYDAGAVVDDGSCAYPELPDASTFDLDFELALDTTGIVFLGDFWGQLGVSNVCGAFEVAFIQDSCGTFGTFLPSYSATGTYALTAQVTAPDTVLSLVVEVVVSQAAYVGCQDLAACNFNRPEYGSTCIYPGEVGWCENPSGEVGYVLAAAAGGDSCLCQSDPFEVLYFEDFGPGGAANGNGQGYGYQGRTEVLSGSGFDVNTAATETEWSIVLNDPNTENNVFDGTEADYWTTLFLEPSGFVEDTAFVGKWLFDVYGWNSRQVSLQGHDWVHAEVEVSENGAMESDDRLDAMVRTELDTTVLGALAGNLASQYPSFTTWSQTWATSAQSLWFELEAENDGEFEYHLFDDVKLSGWGREGCTDSRATVASYDVAADIDDGSCQYDRDTVFARYTGLHTDRLWGAAELATPSRLGGFAQALDSTTSMVVGPQCQVTFDVTGAEGGVVHVDALELRENAAVYLPAGAQLHVHGNFSPAAGRGVYGPGELRLKGGWDWTAVGDSATVSFEDLFLDEGSSLVVPDGSVLELSGDISFPQSTIQTVSGEVDMNGDADQMVSGGVARFDRLVMNKCVTSARVSFDNTLEVLGRLTLNQGIVDMGGDSLVFRSDAAGTGLLDAIPATAELVGSLANDQPVAKTERYIAPDDDGVTFWGYTLFAGSGVEGMTVSDLNGIDGFYSAGWSSSDYPDATSTVLFWDEGTGQIVEPNGDNTPLDTLGGCWITLLGTQTPVMSARGALRDHRENEDTRYAISRTTVEEGVFNGYLQTSNVYSGWNLVPNPYQARLDWNVLFSENADHIEDQYAIFNTQTKQFQYWSSQLDSLQINGSRYIEPGNAFWVRLKEGLTADSLVIPVSAIDNAPAGDGFVRSDEEEAILLEVENAFGRSYVQVRRSEAGSTDYLHGPDISFITSSSVNHAEIAVATGGALFASKVLPEEASAMLFVKSIADWPTTLRVVRTPEGLCGRVIDTETGISLTLTEGEEMTFTLQQQVAEAGRFMLEVRPWAEAEGRMPSCPEALDGEVEVEFGEGVTAHVALTTPQGMMLDQHMSAVELTSFSVAPGDYQVVVTPVAGTFCPKRHREVVVPPGEEPELLGLDWSAPLCNEGTAEVAFELYGGGTFGWTLWNADGDVAEQGAGHGEVALMGLQPGHYVLEVDHPCLSESRNVPAVDAQAPVAEADFADVVVQPSEGEAVTWSALCTTPNVTGCAWWVDGVLVSEEPALDWSTTELGSHTAWLQVERDGCSHETAITFEVVPTMRGDTDPHWSVHSMTNHWLVQWSEGEELTGRWCLRDGRGRLIQTGAASADGPFRVSYPATQGVYFLSLSVSDFTDVKCVFAP